MPIVYNVHSIVYVIYIHVHCTMNTVRYTVYPGRQLGRPGYKQHWEDLDTNTTGKYLDEHNCEDWIRTTLGRPGYEHPWEELGISSSTGNG